MYQKWVTVRITPEQRELFKQWHREAMQRKRLGPLGVGLVSLLAVVSLSHMVLHQRHGAKTLPMVDAQNMQPVVAKKASVFRRVMLFFFLLSIPVLVAAGLLLTLITPTHVRIEPIHIEALRHQHLQMCLCPPCMVMSFGSCQAMLKSRHWEADTELPFSTRAINERR